MPLDFLIRISQNMLYKHFNKTYSIFFKFYIDLEIFNAILLVFLGKVLHL